MNQFTIKLLLISISLTLVSCFKTAEQIRREQKVDQMHSEFGQNQQMQAEQSMALQQIENKINSTNGKIEELQYQMNNALGEKEQSEQDSYSQTQQQIQALVEENKNQEKLLKQIQREQKDQKAYLDRVLSLLKKISGAPVKKGSKKTKKVSEYRKANLLFDAGKREEARTIYVGLLQKKNALSASQRNVVWYNLGLYNKKKKNYDQALSYFSKIYSKFPKSTLAPKSLLEIARCFNFKKDKTKAKTIYSELIKKYPESKQTGLAKKEISKI
ncbi:tetratricopeptide repeat protein [Bacteriovoracaceae bacterium]|nr:tetratricopeptide repeat protein [Bacteriovoracaceae bacterium]